MLAFARKHARMDGEVSGGSMNITLRTQTQIMIGMAIAAVMIFGMVAYGILIQ